MKGSTLDIHNMEAKLDPHFPYYPKRLHHHHYKTFQKLKKAATLLPCNKIVARGVANIFLDLQNNNLDSTLSLS